MNNKTWAAIADRHQWYHDLLVTRRETAQSLELDLDLTHRLNEHIDGRMYRHLKRRPMMLIPPKGVH